jgi:hypothetical protein
MEETRSISLAQLGEMAGRMYGGRLVKAVVDIRRERVVVDAEMNADQEAFLLESGSAQPDLWGINLYPDRYGEDDFIEYDSLINIRHSQSNLSRGVDDADTRRRIEAIVHRVVTG